MAGCEGCLALLPLRSSRRLVVDVMAKSRLVQACSGSPTSDMSDRLRSSRAHHISVPGVRKHYVSPVRKRDKGKTQNISLPALHAVRQQLFKDKLSALKSRALADGPPAEQGWEDVPMAEDEPEAVASSSADVPHYKAAAAPPIPPSPTQTSAITAEQHKRRHQSWVNVLKTLLPELLHYTGISNGSVFIPPGDLQSVCLKPGSCERKSADICCLHFDCLYFLLLHRVKFPHSSSIDFKQINIVYCKCQFIPAFLVHNGMFPTSPQRPNMAVSIPLLEFCRALFERSCDAVNALAAALNTLYTRRGFYLVNRKVRGSKVPI